MWITSWVKQISFYLWDRPIIWKLILDPSHYHYLKTALLMQSRPIDTEQPGNKDMTELTLFLSSICIEEWCSKVVTETKESRSKELTLLGHIERIELHIISYFMLRVIWSVNHSNEEQNPIALCFPKLQPEETSCWYAQTGIKAPQLTA